MKGLRSKISHISYFNEKKRFLLFVVLIVLVLGTAFFLLRMAYARYEMRSKLVANIDKALYIFESGQTSFNLEPTGIIPSNDPYTYRFSVANFTESKISDVDLSYRITIRTTTNLPLTFELYRNQLPTDNGAVNLLSGCTDVQDEDDAWYHVYEINTDYTMLYSAQTTDYYTLVINFPLSYASDMKYVNTIENIEITLKSKQMV